MPVIEFFLEFSYATLSFFTLSFLEKISKINIFVVKNLSFEYSKSFLGQYWSDFAANMIFKLEFFLPETKRGPRLNRYTDGRLNSY